MSKDKVTALLLSWKRRSNIPVIIESLRRQSVSVEIFLWNNAIEDDIRYPVDLQINSSENLMCWTRWMMAVYASGNYICTIDDDLSFSDENVLRDGIEYCESHSCSVGGFGAVIHKDGHYKHSRHIRLTKDKIEEDIEVDVLKGRFILTSKSNLNEIPMYPEDSSVDNPRIEDDIIVSSCLGYKVLPRIFVGRLVDLPKFGNNLFCQSGHMESRERARKKYLC